MTDPATTDPATWIVNTSDATFEADVLIRSKQLPVVVDFWAQWCAPCRALAPVLERLAEEYAGQFLLVKANTDETPQAAGQFSVSGIPAVYAVVDGQVVDGFQGALPEAAVRAWLEGVVGQGALLAAKGLLETDVPAAEIALRPLWQAKPRDTELGGLLAEALLRQGKEADAAEVLHSLEGYGPLDGLAAKVQAALELRSKAQVDLAVVRRAAESQPQNYEQQFALAEALVGHEQYVEAFEVCLQLVMQDRKRTGEKARALMVEVFRALPDDSPLTSEYRRKLSAVLY